MASLIRALLVLIPTIALGAASIPATNETPTTPALEPSVKQVELGELLPFTAADDALVTATYERFDSAGLQLSSEIAVSFHSTLDKCNGNLGLHTTENNHARIRICWSHEDPFVQGVLREQALVHEMAHAWIAANVNDAQRQAFVELTNSDSWGLAASLWEERGTERAADLLTWALLDPSVLFVDVDRAPCTTWHEAYQLLTGLPSDGTLLACD